MSTVEHFTDVLIIGGGAAGFFAALACAQARPGTRIVILEKTTHVLAKIKISGGGRCNVTHACEDPAELVKAYPRGAQALRGAFTRFQPADTVAWFAARGVHLKTEADGRMFPTSDQSQTIIDCFLAEAQRAHIEIKTQAMITALEKKPSGKDSIFRVQLNSGETFSAKRLVLATGSNPQAWKWAQQLGHTLIPPVPSLFSFMIADARLSGLSGLSVPNAQVTLEGSKITQTGPLLITHWGLSGPAVLKMSAWGARWLHEKNYQAKLIVNWLPDKKPGKLLDELLALRQSQSHKKAPGDYTFGLPYRLWSRLSAVSGILANKRWTEISHENLRKFVDQLQHGAYVIHGKNTFKEEFVTCGGVPLDEVDFRTLQSKRCPGLYFAGEVLDIDGITGGFNFQSAWTTGWLAGRAIAAT